MEKVQRQALGNNEVTNITKTAMAIPRGHGFGTRNEDNQPVGKFAPSGKFGRMFPELQPLIPSIESLDALAAVMTDNAPLTSVGDNTNVPAGFTYFGQFIDHDITFDTTSLQETLVDPLALRNFRSPMLDLDSLYGSGPVSQPYLYQRGNNDLLQVGLTSEKVPLGDAFVKPSLPNDLPRSSHGVGLIGDPRNDENLIVAQIHLALIKFHNKVVEGIKNGTIPQESPLRKSPFEEARDLVIWHYQWIVVHDFLGRILDPAQLKLVQDGGRCFYNFDPEIGPFIPVEFSGAAYRVGHTMVREAYDYNRVFTPREGGVTPATLDLLFRFSGLSGSGEDVPIPSDWIIDWHRFFEVDADNSRVGFSRRLDPFLAPKLQHLPNVPPPNSLAARNLRRGRSLGLPPGQSVARFMGLQPLTPDEIAQGPDGAVARQHQFDIESPLWYYILKEAEVQGGGQRLGEVGSRIVAEVFLGLLKGDSSSYVVRKPRNWTPTLPGKQPGDFTMADLLNFVGDLSPIDDPANKV